MSATLTRGAGQRKGG